MSPLLSMHQVGKSFSGIPVLKQISLTLRKGEILSIVGENGAGKSTLGKIIAGQLRPDSGEISMADKVVSFNSPIDARNAGIAMVHQEVCLAENLTIAQNLVLGRERTTCGIIRRSQIDQRAVCFLETVIRRIRANKKHSFPNKNQLNEVDSGEHTRWLKVLLSKRVNTLSLAEKQIVEISRALVGDAQIIIFDEPTASLSAPETTLLLNAIKALKQEGRTIVYISHRLTEICEISDRVFGLRDGDASGTLEGDEINREAVIALMIGRDLNDYFGFRERALGDVMLTVKNFQASVAHKEVSFSVRHGEILAIAGLVGSGRSELLEALAGIRKPISGSVVLNDVPLTGHSLIASLKSGLRFAPENRKEQGLTLDLSILENLTIAKIVTQAPISIRRVEDELSSATSLCQKLAVSCRSLNQPIRELSGGNQQKVALSRCFLPGTHIVLLDEPTRGVDIGAKRQIYQLLYTLAEKGLAVIFVSSELEEVIGIADRALIFSNGALAGELLRAQFSEQAIMERAASLKEISL